MLTESEIDLLGGKDLNTAVAEYIFGEKKPTVGLHEEGHIYPITSGQGWMCSPQYDLGDDCEWEPFPFGTDISCAWSIVERAPKGWSVSIAKTFSGAWRCDYGVKSVIAHRPEIAICKAALKALTTERSVYVHTGPS